VGQKITLTALFLQTLPKDRDSWEFQVDGVYTVEHLKQEVSKILKPSAK